MPTRCCLRLLACFTAATALSGCIAVDYVVDPVGCGTGTHEPIFPWYPHYLWAPPESRAPTISPMPANSAPAAYTPAPTSWNQAPATYAPVPMAVAPATSAISAQ